MSKTLISIVGPTGIGKSGLAVKLAQHFNTEIISSDSRQFYKEMTIGTAVPSHEELIAVKHHFIQHISIHDSYDVGSFERDAIQLLDDLFINTDLVIMVGGSGLYSDAVVEGLDDFPDIDENIRKSLMKRLEEDGIKPLQNKLKDVDLISFQTIDLQNPHRLIRALEVSIGSGKPYSTFLKKDRIKRGFKTLKIGLKASRELIYERIEKRVDMMMKAGLIEEAKQLYPHRKLNALNTVGYKELFKHLNGEWDLDFAISEIKKNTRRFAKRQLTWYRKDDEIKWFDHDSPPLEIIKWIEQNIK